LTIPEKIIFPEYPEAGNENPQAVNDYNRQMVRTLTSSYEEIATAVNGDIRNDQDTDSRQYVPTISGGTAVGIGTYTHQTGWVFRQGIIIDVWFDIRWSAHTGTGTLLVNLPYLSALSDNFPFVGSIQAANITFSGYLTVDVIPNSRTASVRDIISGAGISDISITNADTTIRGHLKYVGQAIERD